MALFSCISAKYQINVVQQRGDETTLRFAMANADFQLLPLNSNGESCTRILLRDAAYDQEKGCPDLPHVAQSIIIPDLPKMKLEIEPWRFENRCGTNAASGIYFVVLELKNSNTTVQLHRTIAGLK